MANQKMEELERLNRLVEEAATPDAKKKALDRFLTHLDAHVAESDELLKQIESKNAEQKQEEMRNRLEQWDTEARAILEREISDPEILEAAIDNSRYKEEVIAIAGESSIRSEVADEKHPLLSKVEEALARSEKQQQLHARLDRVVVISRWVFVIAFLALIGWWAVNYE